MHVCFLCDEYPSGTHGGVGSFTVDPTPTTTTTTRPRTTTTTTTQPRTTTTTTQPGATTTTTKPGATTTTKPGDTTTTTAPADTTPSTDDTGKTTTTVTIPGGKCVRLDRDASPPVGDAKSNGEGCDSDVPVTLSMEVGRTRIPIRNLLQLNQGSVGELERAAGEALDVFVNGTLVAHGEVVVVNEKFGIRLTDVISPAERIRKLK